MSENRLIKPNQLGNFSLWRKVGFHHHGQQDLSETILIRRDRSVMNFKSQQQENSEIKSMDRKSQTEEQKEQFVNRESVFAESLKHNQNDTAFQDVLGVLRMTEANEQQLIERVNTLMNEQQLTLDVSPLQKELFSKNKRDMCQEALAHVDHLRMMMLAMKAYLIQLQSSWENTIKNTLSLKVSMVEQAIAYDIQSPLKVSQASDINILKNYEDEIERLCNELSQKKQQLRNIELKYNEECTTHRAALQRSQLDRKLLNMELNEVVARFDEQRKMLRLRNDAASRQCSCQSNEKIRLIIEAKDNEIFDLKKELQQQYASIENLAGVIRELESKSTTLDSTIFFEQKNNELAQLNMDNMRLKQQLDTLKHKYTALENESYNLYEQNFSLQQTVQSFTQELQEKLNEQKKIHNKQLKQTKELIVALQAQKDKYEDQIQEYKNAISSLQKRMGNAESQRQSNTSLNVTEHFFRPDHVVNSESPTKHKEDTYVDAYAYQSPRQEWKEDVEPKTHVRVTMHKTTSGMQHHSSYYLDQRKPFDVLSRGSFLQRKPVREGRVSPLSQFYPTPDRSRLPQNGKSTQIQLKKILHVKEECGTGRVGSIKSSQNYRSGSNDRKCNQFTNLQMQLNNLTKEIQTQMAQVPLRRLK